MATGDRPPPPAAGAPRTATADMVVYESERTRVVRRGAAGPAGGAVRKESTGPGATERARHERAILGRLRGVPGVAHLVDDGERHGAAVTVAAGGVTLAEQLDGTDRRGATSAGEVVEAVTRALALARTLTGVHGAGVVHLDINPANLLVGDTAADVTLIDWDLATTAAEERPGFTHEHAVAGTLAYLAPEQTGRTGWGVDQRADLYGVGATLYELVTGRPPFGHPDLHESDDALVLIHAHLALVPAAPRHVNETVPGPLSDIIVRLLEKHPDRRYQSAAGLAHDLARLLGVLRTPGGASVDLPLGQRDFPVRVGAPARLVGRDAELDALQAALDGACAGGGRGLLVAGEPGVGKSALLGELRSMVTARGGWLIGGKFDQYRQDGSTDAVTQAFRALARLLLAAPEAQLAELRAHIVEAAGPDAEVLAAVDADLAAVLGVAPADIAGLDRQVVGARLTAASLATLRAVASPERPLVLIVDDLQWAGAFPIGFLDAVLMDDDLHGLLLVGAYRGGEIDEAHPLSAMLARWERLGVAPAALRLENLPPGQLGAFLGAMLRLPADRAAALAGAVGERTGGNPYDTVELVNALRHDGVLRVEETGWRWEPDEVRRFVGRSDVVDLLASRIAALPAASASTLDVLACLGGDVPVGLLARAADLEPGTLDSVLAPALEDGLLIRTRPPSEVGDGADGGATVRFRHDRVQQAARARLDPPSRRARHLELARRLAAPGDAGVDEAAAAEQYLPAAAEVTDPAERRRVAGLFRAAAGRLHVINRARSERFLRAALDLLAAPAGPDDDPLVVPLLIEHHCALVDLGHLDEAGARYGEIERRTSDPAVKAAAARAQIVNLLQQRRPQDAVTLGVGLLGALGFPPPAPEEIGPDIRRRLKALDHWVTARSDADDREIPEPTDPAVLAAAGLIERALPAAFVGQHPLLPWLGLLAHGLWVEHGPTEALAVALGSLPNITVALREDYRTGALATRMALAEAGRRGYERSRSVLHAMVGAFVAPWFDPIEEVTEGLQSTSTELLRYGDLQTVSISHAIAVFSGLDHLPTLDAWATTIDAATAFWARIGDGSTSFSHRPHEQLLRCLRGGTDRPGTLDDVSFTEAAHLADGRANPVNRFNLHYCGALAAAIFGDAGALGPHTAGAMALLPVRTAMYDSAVVRVLHGLTLAGEAAAAPDDARRAAALDGLDEHRSWMATRATGAPANFGHLAAWLDAERAAAGDDLRTALSAFDAAMTGARRRTRPWHAALVTERAGRFHLSAGLDHSGRALLAEAHRLYGAWQADGKTRALTREFPFLASAPTPGPRRSPSIHATSTLVSSDSLDLLAVLRASQALSSETNLARLRARVAEVLKAMTGATSVRLLLWNEETEGWLVPGDGDEAAVAVPLDEAVASGAICLSAFRYAERTGQPLLVPDATGDDRFAGDPYLDGLEACSLLVMPILGRGTIRAMLLLENRLSGGVFTSERLDAVVLIAGQLSVSLDNALAERFRSLVQRSSDLTVVCDRHGVLSYASAVSADLLGIDHARLVGRSVVELVHPDDHQAFGAWLASVAGGEHPAGAGTDGRRIECRVAPADGTLRWVEITGTDLRADPAVSGLVLHLRDVTERRRLEGELRHAQKLESVGQLAAGVAHEINTPIQFITDNLRFVAESIEPLDRLLDAYASALARKGTADELRAARKEIEQLQEEIDLEFLREELPGAIRQALGGADRVARIVRAMKAFAHPGDDRDLVDLNEAIANTLVVANSEIAPVADVVVEWGDIPPVLCNLGDINQVVLNLVVNAAQAMAAAAAAGRGRGTLTVRTAPGDGTVVVEIEDTGPGIPAAIADRVFDQFFTTKPVGVGTGQGLALAHTLVHDRHGGTLTFRSTEDVGTVFTIRLPRHDPDPPGGT